MLSLKISFTVFICNPFSEYFKVLYIDFKMASHILSIVDEFVATIMTGKAFASAVGNCT